MAMYCECPNCGASLDPGERCDCETPQPTLPTPPETEPQKETTPLETAKVAVMLPKLKTAY